jgi:heat shock protein HslJ
MAQGSTGQDPGADIEGRWQLTAGPSAGPPMLGFGIELQFAGAAGHPVPAGGEPSLGPASGTVHGCSGVNRFRGSYWLVGDPVSAGAGILAFGPFVTTMMAGPPAAMTAERGFLALLDRVRGYRASGDELDLLGDSGEALARLARAAPAPILA